MKRATMLMGLMMILAFGGTAMGQAANTGAAAGDPSAAGAPATTTPATPATPPATAPQAEPAASKSQEMVDTVTRIWDRVTVFFVEYGLQILAALVILLIGLFLARMASRMTMNFLKRFKLEMPIKNLLCRVVWLAVMALALLLVMDKLGVQIAPMIAAIGVAGVGIGLAMQGVLSNLVAGLTIIFTKPFRVGEYIEIVGVFGTVANIDLFSTTIVHADKSRFVVPNRKIVGEILHNYGTIRQIQMEVGVAYDSDITKVFAVIRDILQANPKVLKDPAPGVAVLTLADSAITIAVRPWATVEDFGAARADVMQQIILQFRANNISIPFPQREVRMLPAREESKA